MKQRLAIFALLMLGGCAGGSSSLVSDTPPPGQMAMPGRWLLSAPGAPPCGLNFTGRPGANEGNVAPEGGCPERFFASRRWSLQQTTLTIADDAQNPLGQLTFAGDRFEGKSAGGVPLALER
ncbi:MAG: AprI/Inh family metalloprotease inhibitor [Pseudolabrys sp.]|nr:AprI/Inh family metalloprotease inhibitor [Pseudolabrys sp.]